MSDIGGQCKEGWTYGINFLASQNIGGVVFNKKTQNVFKLMKNCEIIVTFI